MSQTGSAAGVQGGGDTGALVAMYEELRSWVLHPGREARPQLRLLGHALLLRSGMREWMAAVSGLQGQARQTPTARASTDPSTETSTTTQLAAALANVILARMKEEQHEP